MTDERREVQRLHLTQPLDAWFGDWPVRLTNVSMKGALIEHADEELPPEARALVRFFWRGQELEMLAQAVRTDDNRQGLLFLDESADLRHAIAASASEVLRAQEANAGGLRELNRIGDETLTAASAARLAGQGFVTFRLVDGAWTRRKSLLPDQPPDGFTIAAGEPEEQIELLLATYERGDTEARRITRLLAELSVADALL
ncbi:MAG TPA: PilZ domain-containing protein [Thermoanaerobaculia bacterium]